jgi:PTS system cellobiose-specific IIC component
MENTKSQKSWADRLADAMEFLAPLFDQPHLASVRDGFVALMPLIIIGAVVLIILQFPCSLAAGSECYLGDTPFFVDSGLADKLWVPFNITFGLLSVYVTLSVSYALARRRGLDPVMPVIFAFLSFLLVASPQIAGGEPATFLDNSGLFTAIVVALISVEVYRFFIARNIVITMPAGVPPAIANAFAALIPGTVIVFGWWVIRFLLNLDIAAGLFEVLSRVVPAASTYVAVAVAETFHAFLWTMGIHGDLTIGIALEPVWTANLAANAQAVAAPWPSIRASSARTSCRAAREPPCRWPSTLCARRRRACAGWAGWGCGRASSTSTSQLPSARRSSSTRCWPSRSS